MGRDMAMGRDDRYGPRRSLRGTAIADVARACHGDHRAPRSKRLPVACRGVANARGATAARGGARAGTGVATSKRCNATYWWRAREAREWAVYSVLWVSRENKRDSQPGRLRAEQRLPWHRVLATRGTRPAAL